MLPNVTLQVAHGGFFANAPINSAASPTSGIMIGEYSISADSASLGARSSSKAESHLDEDHPSWPAEAGHPRLAAACEVVDTRAFQPSPGMTRLDSRSHAIAVHGRTSVSAWRRRRIAIEGATFLTSAGFAHAEVAPF